MPADEVTHGTYVEESRARTGPRHAAPRKPLFTRFHMPAGKAIALATMPTAILMGMGLTPTLANADDHPSSKSLTIDEYQDCVEALDPASPSASASESAKSDKKSDEKETTPAPSATSSEKASSPDSGSDDKTEPAPSASSSSAGSSDSSAGKSSGKSSAGTATPSPSATATGGNVLDDIGNAIKDIFTPDDPSKSETPTATPSPSASASKKASDPVKDTTDKVKDTVKGVTDTATKTAEETAKKAKAAVDGATSSASPSPSASASSTADPDNCPAATDDEGGVENKLALPDEPWYLNASSLLLKGADYQGVVKVKTANGTVKKVLKYVISDGTDIGDLHQTVDDEQSGKTYHVQAGQGTTSTIRDGDTIMYTQSISGNLFGLIPVTFDPDNPPPLNIPLIYFTKVKVVQAGQFGGTLTVPGLHQYTS